jgi:hypothetical protein
VRTEETPSAAKQLGGFIDRFDPAIARLARASRIRLRRYFPTAVELVYDNYNALAIGFASTERMSDVIVSLALTPRGVTLYFMHGKSLPDPRGLLAGEGNQGGYIRLDTAARVDAPPVRALLKAALRHARTPLPKTGRPYTIIKSISKKQRPRRQA